MSVKFRILLAIIAVVVIGYQYYSPPESLPCYPPAEAELIENYRGEDQVIQTVKDELAKTEENPADFFVELREMGDSYTVLLWHRDSFLQENCNRVGNTSGHNRTYIIESNEVVEELWWL